MTAGAVGGLGGLYVTPDAAVLGARRVIGLLECDALTLGRRLVDAATSAEELTTPELIAHELREAMQCLAALTGEVPTEELLGRVFARFCIGK